MKTSLEVCVNYRPGLELDISSQYDALTINGFGPGKSINALKL